MWDEVAVGTMCGVASRRGVSCLLRYSLEDLKRTPSIQAGLTLEKELAYRRKAVELISHMTDALKV